jgi:hypothetical protein
MRYGFGKNKKWDVFIYCFFFSLTILLFDTKYAQDQSSEDTRPNFLLILTDDQGYHFVSYYGTKDVRPPHIVVLSWQGSDMVIFI